MTLVGSRLPCCRLMANACPLPYDIRAIFSVGVGSHAEAGREGAIPIAINLACGRSRFPRLWLLGAQTRLGREE